MGAVHHAIAPSMYPKLDYDIEKDFVPLALLASVPQVMVVNPQRGRGHRLQGRSWPTCKNPGKLNYASAGNGTSHHLAGELFKLQTKTFITHIPYRGAGPGAAGPDRRQGRHDVRRPGLVGRAHQGRPHQGADGGGRQAATRPSPTCPAPPKWACPTTPSPPGTACGRPRARRPTCRRASSRHAARRSAGDELKAIWASNGAEIPNLTQAQFGTFVSARGQALGRRW